MRSGHAGEDGYTFLGLLFLIAIMAIMASAAAVSASFVAQRDEEEQLLFVGHAYRVALQGYRQAHASRPQPYPKTLAELLGDPSELVPRRYLRRLYFDPLSGSQTWGLVRNEQGGITGIYSLSMRQPIRTKAIGADDGIAFAAARSYRDWVFSAVDPQLDAPPPQPVPGDDARPPTPGKVPGWNYDRDGEPPLKWSPQHPAPAPTTDGG